MFRKLLAIVCLIGALTSAADARRICPILCGAPVAYQGPVLPSYLGGVATRAAMPINITSTSFLFANSRSWHIARDNIPAISIILPAYYSSTSAGLAAGQEATTTGSIVYTASVEYPIGSNKTQITWSTGAASITVSPLSQARSDVVTLPTTIPRGAIFRLWVFENASASSVGVVYGNNIYAPNGDVIEFSLTSITDKTLVNGATITQAPTPANAAPIMPVAILGNTTRASIAMFGDSRMAGFKDVGDASGDIGIVARSLGPTFAYTNMGSPGSTGNNFRFAGTPSSNRMALKAFYSHIVMNYPGINDVAAAVGLAQSQSDLTGLIAAFSPKPVLISTIEPTTSSTDSWATTANQTISGLNTNITAYNNYYLTPPAGVTAVYNVMSAVSTASNSGIWKVTGAPFGWTADGLHESQFGNLSIQSSGVVSPLSIH